MPFALLLALFTAITTDAVPVRTQPEQAAPQRVRLADGMPVYLRAFAAEHSRRLAEKRTRTRARPPECGGTGRPVVSRPWNRTRTATQPGLVTGSLGGVAGPLEGARIAISRSDLIARSARDGSFQIAIPSQQLRDGLLTVTVQAIGYRPYRTEVRLEAGDSAHLSVTLCRQTIQLTQIAATPPAPVERRGSPARS